MNNGVLQEFSKKVPDEPLVDEDFETSYEVEKNTVQFGQSPTKQIIKSFKNRRVNKITPSAKEQIIKDDGMDDKVITNSPSHATLFQFGTKESKAVNIFDQNQIHNLRQSEDIGQSDHDEDWFEKEEQVISDTSNQDHYATNTHMIERSSQLRTNDPTKFGLS